MIAESIPLDARPKLATRARMQTDPVTGKPVLLYPEGVLVLNATGHEIILHCTGDATVGEIIAGLAARYNMPKEQLSREVNEYLNRLRARKLLDLGAGA